MKLRLYKYRSFTTEVDRQRVKGILQNRELYCSLPSELNDPYDCNIGTANHLMHMIVDSALFCMSGEGHDEILLFSHYANKHTGFAFVFEADNSKSISRISFLSFSEPVNYVQNFPRYDTSNIHHVMRTKHICWKYEEEYRSVANLEYNPSKFRHFEINELVEIRCGVKMKDEDQDLIKQWALESGFDHIRFTKACLAPDKFKLEYKPISFP